MGKYPDLGKEWKRTASKISRITPQSSKKKKPDEGKGETTPRSDGREKRPSLSEN